MSHEFESGLFVSKPAWHGLGTVLDNPPTIEEAIVAAGLDWDVQLMDMTLKDREVSYDENDLACKAVIRSKKVEISPLIEEETEYRQSVDILGVVGPDYVPLQNRDAFKWFQPLIDSKDFQIEAAGSLRGGKRIWILAKAADLSADVVPGDRVDQYLLLAHGHDGTLSIRLGFTCVRVVCQNTLSAAIRESGSLVRIRHQKGAAVAMEGVRELIQVARGDFAALFTKLVDLAKVQISPEMLNTYVREVFSPDDETGSPRIVEKVVELFETGRGHEFGSGTYWNAYNAITEFLTHERGRNADARVERMWFGLDATLAARALELGLRLSRS